METALLPLHSAAAKDSCRICVFFVVSRKWQSCHMGQSRPWWWQLFGVLEEIDLWHGVIQNTVVTAPESKISYGMFSRFVVHLVLFLQFWRTEPSWHGALDIFSAQDSSSVQDHLKNVQHISGTARAFAAILADGSVLTWGDPHYGGDSSRGQDQLKNVQQICGTKCAFKVCLLCSGWRAAWVRRGGSLWSLKEKDAEHVR